MLNVSIAIFKESGILKHLEPGNLVMAERGFTVRELLNPRQVQLMIPAFLKGRKSLTAAEELETCRIAKARIHVERFNERLEQFRLVSRKLPLSLAPLGTPLVVVTACLVNFQGTLCKQNIKESGIFANRLDFVGFVIIFFVHV